VRPLRRARGAREQAPARRDEVDERGEGVNRPEAVHPGRAARAREDEAFAERVGTAENPEAIAAFFEKRTPEFSRR
jgi:hypothetical protein